MSENDKGHEDLRDSGEHLEISPQTFADSFIDHARHITKHFGNKHPYETSFPIGENGEQVVVSPDDVEVKEAEESGKFVVRIKNKVVEHPGRTAAVTATVTGAAVLSAFAIHVANKKKKK